MLPKLVSQIEPHSNSCWYPSINHLVAISMALKGGKVPLEDDSTSSSDGATPAPGSVPSTYDVISLTFWIFLFNKSRTANYSSPWISGIYMHT